MAILDYSAILGRPFQGAGQVAIQTEQGMQGLRANEQQMTMQRQEYQDKKDAAQNKVALNKQAQEVYARGDVNEIAEFTIANPIRGKNILAARGLVGDEAKKRVSDRFAGVLTSTDPQATLEQFVEQGEADGLDMTQSKEILAQDLGPEGIKRAAGTALASIDGQRFKDIQSSFNDKKATLSAEASSFNELIKDFTPEEQKTARRIKAGLKGRAVSNAELSAIASGDIKSYSDYKTQQKQREKFAELTGSSRAKAIDKGFETITKIDGSVRNIDRAISALNNNAGVGVFEKMWPSIAAASVELDNIRGSMALDVVGATTFGALSKGELDLAKDVALPTGLDTDELIDYLERKKVAQQKLRDYYNEQVQFLDQGGTIAGFLRSKEKGQSQQGVGNDQGQKAPQAALQMLQQNPAMAEQFKAKYGYLPEGM